MGTSSRPPRSPTIVPDGLPPSFPAGRREGRVAGGQAVLVESDPEIDDARAVGVDGDEEIGPELTGPEREGDRGDGEEPEVPQRLTSS